MEPPRSAVRSASITALATTTGAMPVFLVGAVAVLLRRDLGLSAGDIGFAVSAFFAGSAVFAAVGGRLVDRLGPWRVLRMSTAATATLLAAIALLAHGLPALLVLGFVAGASNGLTQPAGNAALAGGHYRRPALTFGIKQASIPFATLVAGLSVPTIAVHVGWRGSFLATSLLALGVSLLLPRRRSTVHVGAEDAAPAVARPITPSLLILAAAAGLGTACATSLAAYFAEGAADVGLAVGPTGWLIATCGIVGILARVAAGWAGDRTNRSLLIRIAAMLACGALGYGLLSIGAPLAFGVGALLVYSLGWGWSGLLMFSVVRLHPDTPATATGVIGSGAAIGATLGPIATGQTIEATSYGVAWLAVGSMSIVAGVLVLAARRSFIRLIYGPAGRARTPATQGGK